MMGTRKDKENDGVRKIEVLANRPQKNKKVMENEKKKMGEENDEVTGLRKIKGK